jgi:hypothetical protein
MSETLIPTMGLRYEERDVETPALEPGLYYWTTVRMLQQRFTTPAGVEVWKDVPLVQGFRVPV